MAAWAAHQPFGLQAQNGQEESAKKIAETNVIFDHLKRVHDAAADNECVLRLSIEAKATVKIGPFSRNGQRRLPVKAADHDFKPAATLTPFGIYLPDFSDRFLYMTTSKVTSDFMVDYRAAFWEAVRDRFPKVTTLLINVDNGPESHNCTRFK